MAVLNPYLGFRDDARDALEFYHRVFGGELAITTFGEFDVSDDPAEANRVMHGQLETPSGFTLMASDTPSSVPYTPGSTISISISGQASEGDELRGYWDALAEGGQVTMPLEQAPWGGLFGMVTDRFGAAWMVSIAAADG
jgi:PhnB protein